MFEADDVNVLFVSNIEVCEKIIEQTTNLAKPPESTNPKSDEAPPDEKRYPKTRRFIFVTLGVMAAVLVVTMAWTTILTYMYAITTTRNLSYVLSINV